MSRRRSIPTNGPSNRARDLDEKLDQRRASSVTALDTYASTDTSHIQNVSAEALGVRSIPPKTGDDWDHIEEILEHWNRTSNAGLPAMPDPWPPEF